MRVGKASVFVDVVVNSRCGQCLASSLGNSFWKKDITQPSSKKGSNSLVPFGTAGCTFLAET